MKDSIYTGQPNDAVDAKLFDAFVTEYHCIYNQVEELSSLVNGILQCKDKTDRLTFFLENIYEKNKN